MLKPSECAMRRFFCNGEDYDYCSLSGEPTECYEEGCEKGDADDAPDTY